MSDLVGNPEDRFSRVAAHNKVDLYSKTTDLGKQHSRVILKLHFIAVELDFFFYLRLDESVLLSAASRTILSVNL